MLSDRDNSAQTSELITAVDDRSLLAGVARSHYLDDVSRVEIASYFDISRFKVARLLARARKEDIVSIEINDAGVVDALQSAKPKDVLRLKACYVVRSSGSKEDAREEIGATAANLLTNTLTPGDILGVVWGRTLSTTIRHLTHVPPTHRGPCG